MAQVKVLDREGFRIAPLADILRVSGRNNEPRAGGYRSAGSDTFMGRSISRDLHRSFARITRALLTCWPVLTEVAWLLRRYPRVIQQLLDSSGNGFLSLLPLTSEDAKAIGAMMLKSENIRPQLSQNVKRSMRFSHWISVIFCLQAWGASAHSELFQNWNEFSDAGRTRGQECPRHEFRLTRSVKFHGDEAGRLLT
jgi:hypothetical protein